MTEYGAGKTAFLSEENCRWSSGESSFEAQGPTPIPPGPAADLQTPGPSSAGAQRSFRWQDKQFFPTPQQPPTIAADEDPEIAASLEADTEEDAYRTAGLQQPKPVSQPERSSGKRKAKSSASQAGGEKQGAERALWREVGRF